MDLQHLDASRCCCTRVVDLGFDTVGTCASLAAVRSYGVSDVVDIARRLNTSHVRVVGIGEYVACLRRALVEGQGPAYV